MTEDARRCFGDGDPVLASYHDQEWGVPVHGDQALFEHLVLDGFQAGLSWRIILNKRQAFREAFANFDPRRVAGFNQQDEARMLNDAGIVRNRLKIRAAISNAQALLRFQREHGSFDRFLWGFTGGRTLRGPAARTWQELPTTSPEAEAMSAALIEHGFKFVGPTICYAFMQAVGMVDDHLVDCFRFVDR